MIKSSNNKKRPNNQRNTNQKITASKSMTHLSPRSKQVMILSHRNEENKTEDDSLNDHYDIYVDLRNHQLRRGSPTTKPDRT